MPTALTKLPGRRNLVTEGSMPLAGYDERRMQRIAREIAMDVLEIEQILEINAITTEEWEALKESQAFATILQREIENWNSALSTAERVRIKALSVVEDSLLTAAGVINDPAEGAQGRARMLEAVAKIANVGEKAAVAGEGGKVMIQINMGADRQLNHEVVTPEVKVIEGEANA